MCIKQVNRRIETYVVQKMCLRQPIKQINAAYKEEHRGQVRLILVDVILKRTTAYIVE